MPPYYEDDKDEFEYGYFMTSGARTDCESARAWEVKNDVGETQMVFPVEHGVNCRGHRMYAPKRISDRAPYMWSMDADIPEFYGRRAVKLDVSEEYL